MRTPCDEVVAQSTGITVPCAKEARTWVLAATILGSSMAFIDGTVVNVALPALQASFHATVVDLQWVVESYGLLLAALILVGGSFGDRFGRRLIFVTGVLIFALASAGCGLSSSIHQLIIARSLQGVGAALLVPGSLAIISTSFDEKSRGLAIGTWSGFTAITTAIGPVLGGWLVEHASWRWVFFLNLPLAAAVVVISLWRIPESRSGSAGRIDWLGAILSTLGLAGLVVGFVESTNLGWRSPVVFGSLIAGVGCLIAFVFAEAASNSPTLPLALFQSRSFSGANLLTLLLYAATGIFFFLFPLNLIQVQGYSTTATGAAILPMILLMFFLSRWSGGLVARYGARAPLIIGPFIVALGFALFAVPSIAGNYWGGFFPAIIILGFGMAVTVAPLTTVVMNSVSGDRVGAASGVNNAVSRVASVLAVAVLGIVMVKAFAYYLNPRLDQLMLSPGVLAELQSNEIKLAGLQVPPGLSLSTQAAISRSIREAFVFGFRVVIVMCVALSLGSAAVTWVLIPKDRDHRNRAH
ncbi:MAG TPA: MFS transporter [Terriglobales bacterium]|jgi:EmrB/QacA subfamily drug resistance transporter|nr:MFS transporter [Terriglobales bacterium]